MRPQPGKITAAFLLFGIRRPPLGSVPYKIRARLSFETPGPKLKVRLSSDNVRESRLGDDAANPSVREPTRNAEGQHSTPGRARSKADRQRLCPRPLPLPGPEV